MGRLRRPQEARLRQPQEVWLRRPQEARLRRPQEVWLRRPQEARLWQQEARLQRQEARLRRQEVWHLKRGEPDFLARLRILPRCFLCVFLETPEMFFTN